ncbi:MAG TPA: hypothetical protein VIK57_12355 [Streptosporangiaceae bacterium]
MSSEITELITALRNGTMSLEEVAQRFRERSWPRARGPELHTYLDFAAAAQEDPEPLVSGSFDEVAAAYRRGELSRPDYRVLAEAAAEGMHREDLRRGSTE